MRFAGIFYLFTIPIAAAALKVVNETNLTSPGHCLSNKLTIIFHSAGAVALAAGFVVYGLHKT